MLKGSLLFTMNFQLNVALLLFWLLLGGDCGLSCFARNASKFILNYCKNTIVASPNQMTGFVLLIGANLATRISAHTSNTHTQSSCICPWGSFVSNSLQERFPYLDSHYRKIPGYGLSQPVGPVLSRNFFKEGRGP